MMFVLSLLFLTQPQGDASPSSSRSSPSSPISCYNDDGDPVDWFYLYKLPKHSSPSSPSPPSFPSSLSEGLRYLLLEPGSEGWTEGKETMNDTSGAPGRTLGQLYSTQQNPEVAYILYNDQPPDQDQDPDQNQDPETWRSTGGHTKGVVFLDKNQGFWLVHSTPRFPAPRPIRRYFYPESGTRYGQNLLCISFPRERFQTIGEQLQINQPFVYDCDVPQSLAALLPGLAALCHKPSSNQIPQFIRPAANRSVTLTSRGGASFISFAKGASFNNDLYLSWVAPFLSSDLLVQFWIHSPGILPSNCSLGWKVLDITNLRPGSNFSFNTSHDHSKWAVSPTGPGWGGTGEGGWVCVGDINRNQAEEHRGGGTVCQQDVTVWKAYRAAALLCGGCEGGEGPCATGGTQRETINDFL